MISNSVLSAWVKKPLQDCIELIRNGCDLEQQDEGLYPISRIETISEGRIDSRKVKYCNPTNEQIEKYKINEGDILFSHINSPTHIGKTALYTGEPSVLIHGINLLLLRPQKNIVDSKYLDYYLKSPIIRRYFKVKCKKAVSQASLNQQDIKSLMIPIPPIETQKRIATIISKAEKAVELRMACDKLTEEYLKSVFYQMFGDPVNNTKGWRKVKIGDIAEVKTGGTPRRDNQDYWGQEVPWVKTTELTDGVIQSTEEYLTEEGLKNSNATIFPKGTILVAMYGQGKTRGRTAKLGIDASTNQACAAILPSKSIEIDFIWYFLILSYENLRALGRGGNQPNLNLSMIRDFEVYLPPIIEQKRFTDIVKTMEGIKKLQFQSRCEIEELYESLIHKAFTGELET